jgi:hypothetical protein
MYNTGDRFFAKCFRGTYFILRSQFSENWEVEWDAEFNTNGRLSLIYGSELEKLEYFQTPLILVKDDKHFLELLLKYA